MSLIITIRTPEGAIMAADSRTTWSSNLSPDRTMVGIHFSDTTNKLFQAGDRFGISTCGDASINGRSISAWMDEFVQSDTMNETSVQTIANALGQYFVNLQPTKDVIFHVTGYEEIGQGNNVLSFYRVVVAANGGLHIVGPNQGCGASWDGETTTMTRLLKSCFIAEESVTNVINKCVINATQQDGTVVNRDIGSVITLPVGVPHFPEASINWGMFTLQEAIDFAVYAVRTTIATMRFQSLPVTVGEPIDLLVIKPNQVLWLSKKELHMS